VHSEPAVTKVTVVRLSVVLAAILNKLKQTLFAEEDSGSATTDHADIVCLSVTLLAVTVFSLTRLCKLLLRVYHKVIVGVNTPINNCRSHIFSTREKGLDIPLAPHAA
jgi:hypothetical protein